MLRFAAHRASSRTQHVRSGVAVLAKPCLRAPDCAPVRSGFGKTRRPGPRAGTQRLSRSPGKRSAPGEPTNQRTN